MPNMLSIDGFQRFMNPSLLYRQNFASSAPMG